MKATFITLSTMSENLSNIRDNDLTNIRITNIHPDAIPYLDWFIDTCQNSGCNVSMSEQLLMDHDILEHFCDTVEVC